MISNNQRLLRVLENHAPNGEALAHVAKLYAQTPEKERERMLVHALADGLDYGNWPWTVSKANTEAES